MSVKFKGVTYKDQFEKQEHNIAHLHHDIDALIALHRDSNTSLQKRTDIEAAFAVVEAAMEKLAAVLE